MGVCSFINYSKCSVWTVRTTGCQNGVPPPFPSLGRPSTTPEHTPITEKLRSLLLHTHSVCFNSPGQEFGRPDSSWQGEESAVCIGPFIKTAG